MITPILDRIVLKREAEVSQTASGLYVAGSVSDSSDRGTVVGVGIDVKCAIKPGDVVIIARGAGQVVKLDGEEFVIVTKEHVLAVIS